MKYAIVMIVAVGALFIVGCSDEGYSVTGMVTYMPTIYEVHIDDSGFTPETITIRPADRVKWIVIDGSHRISDIGGSFDSGELGPGESFEAIFAESGNYIYQDRVSGYFGEVRVV